MTDLRENLGWLIGSIATAIAMAFGWLTSSGVVVNLLFLLIGSGITYFVQTKTQKRAWKREYSVKIAETVYGTLFGKVNYILRLLEKKVYHQLDFEEWRQIQVDHRYFMVEGKFRTRLDNFLERVQRYSDAVSRLRSTILPKIANEETERVFNLEAFGHASLNVEYKHKRDNFSESPHIIPCLVSKTHPKDRVFRGKSEISNVKFDIRIKKLDGGFYHSDEVAKFDEFWESCVRRMKEDKTYKFIIEENEKLLEDARKLQKEIVKRIEEPWKI